MTDLNQFLTVPEDAISVIIAIGKRVSECCSYNYHTKNQELEQKLVWDAKNTVLNYSYGPLKYGETTVEDNILPNVSRLIIVSPQEWNNRDIEQYKQSNGELFPEEIYHKPSDIHTTLQNYKTKLLTGGTMTFFPRNWPGILSIDCENKRKPEVNDSLQYQHEITREVWTNGESMVEEINRRRRDPEYLKKKITEKTNRINLMNKFYEKLSGPNPRRNAIEAAIIHPPSERTLTIPPWRLPVQILLATHTNPPLAPRGTPISISDRFK